MKIQHVPTDAVQRVWPIVEKYLHEALVQGQAHEYNVDQLRALTALGVHELLVAVAESGDVVGAATVVFTTYPQSRVAFVTAIGGRLISSRDTWEQFSNYLRYRGATHCQGAVRESVARLWSRFGFKPRHTIVEIDL